MKRFILILILNITLTHAQESETSLSIFTVEGNELKENIYRVDDFEENERAIELWEQFYSIFPKEIIDKYIKQFEIMSDGKEEELAAIEPISSDNKQWKLIIDIEDARDNTSKQYLHTLIHEFGHLITLNDKQVTPTEDEYQEGDLYLTQEGYANKNSYLNTYVSVFWYGKLLDKWDTIKYTKNENRKVKKLLKFYHSNPNTFVSDYAAESPEEDIAESWTHFVFSNSIINSNFLKDKKVNFFYQFSELLVLKKRIRNAIKQY